VGRLRLTPEDRWGWEDAALIAAAVGAFLALFLPGWQAHQAPHPDDARILAPSWGFLTQNAVLLRRSVTVSLFGLRVPLMLCTEHGPYEGYISLPFLALWRNTARAIDCRNAFFGSLTVASLYYCARRLFDGRSAAFVAALLLARSAWFILACRFGLFTGVSVMAFGLLALGDFLHWSRGRDPWALLRALAWTGLGCCTDDWFWGTAAGFLACAVVFRGQVRAAWAGSRARAPWLSWACPAAFLIWAVPPVLGNALGGWFTFRFFWSRLHGGGAFAAGWSDWAGRFAERGGELALIPTGFEFDRVLAGHPWPATVSRRLLWAPSRILGLAVLAELAILICAWSSWAPRIRAGAKRLRLLLLIAAAHWLLSVFGPTAPLSQHLYPIMPLLYLGAAALPCVFPGGKARRAAWAIPAALLAASVLQSSAVLADARRGLDQTGGCGVESSSSVVDLARWLEARPQEHPVALTFRDFSSNLLYFTGGRVDPVGAAWDPESGAFADPDGLSKIAHRDPRALFLVAHCHEPCVYDDEAGKDALPAFRELVRRWGGTLELAAAFPTRDGQPAFEAYRVAFGARR